MPAVRAEFSRADPPPTNRVMSIVRFLRDDFRSEPHADIRVQPGFRKERKEAAAWARDVALLWRRAAERCYQNVRTLLNDCDAALDQPALLALVEDSAARFVEGADEGDDAGRSARFEMAESVRALHGQRGR